ncbi:MAG: hypothetical protein OSB10_09800, partial [Planctomycetota bacterium]|nr:hypothetical protein [Planctomycetota bacterium]
VGTLTTVMVQETVEGSFGQARFVHGDPNEGDREFTIVPVGEYGDVVARVPVGTSMLEVPGKSDSSRKTWDLLRVVDIR